MKSLILVIEHRTCDCGASYLAPNPRLLSRRELRNLRGAHILLPENDKHVPEIQREIIHLDIDVECCPRCFHQFNGFQFELFPKPEPLPLAFINGRIEIIEPPKPNPFTLSYF